MRIGHGYDVHRFTEGDSVTLGGVVIAHSRSLLAHSDGDVLLHALTDALLGACALGDIGQHFPDTDPRYRGIDSRKLLREAYQLVAAQGFELSNADITVIAEAPKLASHCVAMRSNIAEDLKVEIGQINVKATTSEKLGFTGREEGISTHAVVLLRAVTAND